MNNNYNSFLKYLNIFSKNIQYTNTSNDTNDTNINDTNTDGVEIFSEDYIIMENNNSINLLPIIKNNSNNEEIDMSSIIVSTNITNEIVNKYFNKLNMLVNINIQKSINWCKKHQFIINKEFILKY